MSGRVIWVCFAARLVFYAAMLPLWEGYDEWAHFSVIRSMVVKREALVARDQVVPRDVAASLRLAPVAWSLREMPAPSVTQDAWWELTPEQRGLREAEFRAMPAPWGREDEAGGPVAYEALQPPLYYWLMTPAMAATLRLPLAAQVLTIRWLSVALASLVIPLIFQVTLLAFGDRRTALWSCAAVAVMPGLAFDVARVGNDCLAVVLFSVLIWVGLQRLRGERGAVPLGVALGLGLLTKAYFLTAVPAVLGLELWLAWKRKVRGRAYLRALAPVGVAAAVAGWWYGRNLVTTGTLAGLSESVMLRGESGWSLLRRAAEIPWGTAVDSILFSQLYFGGWSSLTVRSWMYHALYLVAAVAAIGVAREWRRPAVWWLAAVYAMFWAGQCYNVVLLFVSKGLPGSMGWYLYGVIAAQAGLCAGGLAAWRRWLPAVAAGLFAALDLYAMHFVAIPYYTGMIGHRANGALASLHLTGERTVGMGAALERLTVFKGIPTAAMAALWVAYLAATVWAAASAGFGKTNDESFR